MDKKKVMSALIPIAVTVILALLPVPQGLTPKAWYYFAVFTGVVAGMILEPLPIPVVCIIGLVVASSFGLVAPKPGDHQMGTLWICEQHGLAYLCGIYVRCGI